MSLFRKDMPGRSTQEDRIILAKQLKEKADLASTQAILNYAKTKSLEDRARALLCMGMCSGYKDIYESEIKRNETPKEGNGRVEEKGVEPIRGKPNPIND